MTLLGGLIIGEGLFEFTGESVGYLAILGRSIVLNGGRCWRLSHEVKT